MLINHILLGGLGLMFGFAAAGGTFALIVAISVVPRIIGMSRTAAHVLFYESMVMLGGVLGNIVTVFPQLPIPFGRPMLALFGLGSGIQVGCLVMALAEAEVKEGIVPGYNCACGGKGDRRPFLFFPADGVVLMT